MTMLNQPSRTSTALPLLLFSGAALLSAGATADAQDVQWRQIDGAWSANDMSPDGRFVVGEVDQDNDFFPDGTYIWDRETDEFTILPPEGLTAWAVSDDGSVILGSMVDPDEPQESITVAAIWTEPTGWFSLGYLPGAAPCPSRSNGYELSADGTVAVGLSFYDGCKAAGFRWTAETGMQPLESLANGVNRASVVSADGNTIGGFAQGSFSRTPAIWDGESLNGELLDPPNGDALGEIFGLSDDASILLGTWQGKEVEQRATKWTLSNDEWVREMIGDGSLSLTWQGIPMDIADNGTIVGFDFLPGVAQRRAWIQPNGEGSLVNLETYIEENGGSIPAGEATQVCQAISSNGRVIVGHSWPETAAWIVTIDHPSCPADIAPVGGDGVINVTDLLELLAQWGSNCPCSADIAPNGGDGFVDVTDLLELLGSWGDCAEP